MLRSSALAAALLVAGLALPAQAATPKLAVVDVQRVMEAIPTWTKAVDGLRKDFDKKKVELEGKQADLQKRRGQLDAKRMVSDPKALAVEEEKFMASANEFRMEFMQAQQDISQREVQLKDAMLARIERIVTQLAQLNEYDYVFELGPEQQRNVLYADKKIDITGQVIEAYKKGFGDEPLLTANQSKPQEKKPQQKK